MTKLTLREVGIHSQTSELKAGGPEMGNDTALLHIHSSERRRIELALQAKYPQRENGVC